MGVVIPVTPNWEHSGKTSNNLFTQCFEEEQEITDILRVSENELAEGKIKAISCSKSTSIVAIFASAPLWKSVKDKLKRSYLMESLIEEIVH